MRKTTMAVVTVTATLLSNAAFAEERPTAQGLLENICIGGRLDEKLLEPYVQHTGEFFKMKITKLPAEALPTINPDATSAWGLSGSDRSFVVAFARKTADGFTNSSCSVATEADDEIANAVKTFIETKYKVRTIADQQQGSSTLTVYRGELLGFDAPKNFSVQHVAGGGVSGMLMVSFFDSAP